MVHSGVHTALVTPFTAHGVDLEAFRALCERQLEAGVHGLVPCGTTGETPTLTSEEWTAVVGTAVDVADGRVPVTAGCGTNNTVTTVAQIQRASALGADAALVVLPYYNKPNPAGHLAHMGEACSVGLPVVAYHVPGRTGQRLPAAQLAEICAINGVVALKEATGDLALAAELVALTEVQLLSGDDFTALPLLRLGGHGLISVLSNVDPWRTVALYEAATTSALEKAQALHDALMPLVDFLFSDSNPVPCKAAMSALGHCENRVRLPLCEGSLPEPSLLQEVAR